MSTPNRFDVVQQANAERPDLLRLNTTESCTKFRHLVALRLHADDPNWGELSKPPGQHQGPDGRSVDAIIYKPTQQVIDIIAEAEWGTDPGPPGFRPARPAWQEVPKRDDNHWVAPVGAPEPVPEPPPPAPAPCDCDGIKAILGGMIEAQTELDKRLRETRNVANAALARVQLLEEKVGRLKVRGGTSREWGHAHRVELFVVDED